MAVPMSWLVATIVILQFSLGVGRNTESPEFIQQLNDAKKFGDISKDFDDMSKDFDDMSKNFETRRGEMENTTKIAIGCIFGFFGLCLLVSLSIWLCCPQKCPTGRRILIVASPVEVHNPQAVRTEHYPPPPPSYNDSMQQFPAQYNPPPAGQQTQYPAVHNPGFQ